MRLLDQSFRVVLLKWFATKIFYITDSAAFHCEIWLGKISREFWFQNDVEVNSLIYFRLIYTFKSADIKLVTFFAAALFSVTLPYGYHRLRSPHHVSVSLLVENVVGSRKTDIWGLVIELPVCFRGLWSVWSGFNGSVLSGSQQALGFLCCSFTTLQPNAHFCLLRLASIQHILLGWG